MIPTFRDFLDQLIVESLHPELAQIVRSGQSHVNKKTLIANKVRELSKRGEDPGISGTPAGSARVFLEHKDPEHIIVDGHHVQIPTGTKVAIKGTLEKYHDKSSHDGQSLGEMQMQVENGDYYVNSHYRVLTQHPDNPHHYESNEDGIFPPLIEHDHDNHAWSHIGHAEKLTNMRHHTKAEGYPKGISHEEFCTALIREWNKIHGRHYTPTSPEGIAQEKKLDHIQQHPLVQKFLDHQYAFSSPPHDYAQKANLGVWTHPVTGETHIVARDHGFSAEVLLAYKRAREKEWKTKSRNNRLW